MARRIFYRTFQCPHVHKLLLCFLMDPRDFLIIYKVNRLVRKVDKSCNKEQAWMKVIESVSMDELYQSSIPIN